MKPILNLWNSKAGCPAPECTFDTFAVADSNREAFFSAKAVLDRPGIPLVLCGGPGLGKTHLLHAIHTEILAQNPAAVIKHLNADDFTSCLIHAIHAETTDQFRAECQNAAVFLLDDVHFLAGKQHTQEELLLILEARCRSNRRTVITLDCPAETLLSTEHSFRSRFPDMVLAVIAEPDYEVRAGIVRAKAADLDLQLSEEEIDLIAQRVPGNLRNLHGVLNQINLYQSFPEAFPDAPSVSEIVRGTSH